MVYGFGFGDCITSAQKAKGQGSQVVNVQSLGSSPNITNSEASFKQSSMDETYYFVDSLLVISVQLVPYKEPCLERDRGHPIQFDYNQ